MDASTPEHPLQRPTLARFRRLIASGDARAARQCLLDALAREPNLPRVQLALARLRWPGPDYRAWLAWLHARIRPRVYLEIGVERGDTLRLAQPPTRVIGIDPAPVGDVLARGTCQGLVARQTSAAFLAAPPAEAGLQDGGFDLAFIDGDHRFASVLDDFIGLEALAAPGAVIAVHDTLPIDALSAASERRSGFYTGDGWKLVPCLRALRPALRIVTLPTAPTGLTLITGLDRRSAVLRDRRALILEAYAGLDARRVVARPGEMMALGENDPAWLTRWLAAARGR